MADEPAINTEELDHLYDEVVESHREYLERVQSAFDKRCEEIGADAKKKLEQIPEDDEEARKEVLMEEQRFLDQTLSELKHVVARRDADVRKKLEEIEKKREESALDLEAELAKL